MELTPDQINQLQQLGVDISQNKKPQTKSEKGSFPIFPLLSISGLTLLSFSGIVLLKNKTSSSINNQTTNSNTPSSSEITPTQVPKSIQHYLLTSQQFYSRAVQLQGSQNPATAGSPDQQSTIELLNQSILAATSAIKEFPTDYRGFYQRGRIYQSVATSNPSLLTQAISDFTSAQKLDPNNPEITRSLASVYAQKGDPNNTIYFLNQTITLEPTKAQNFYDLAKIQQQVGYLPQALETYDKLISLVTDPTQKNQIESEKTAIEKIIAQNPNKNYSSSQNTKPVEVPTISLDSPTIQALSDSSLIVAAPEKINQIQVSSITDSNSLSGTATLSANQKEITLQNSNLKDSSQVYVTIISGGKNQNLQVLSKSNNSFTIGLDSAISEPIEFKWWIIN